MTSKRWQVFHPKIIQPFPTFFLPKLFWLFCAYSDQFQQQSVVLMVIWAYGFCVSCRDAVNRGGVEGLQTQCCSAVSQAQHGDLAKETQSRWQRSTKRTMVLNCGVELWPFKLLFVWHELTYKVGQLLPLLVSSSFALQETLSTAY